MKRRAVCLLKIVGGAAGLVAIVGTLAIPAYVSAQQSSSTNYQVNEVFFGTGGELNACSTNYCSKQSAGETTVGNTTSTNYQAQGGFNTNREEYIEFIITSSTTDLGVLSSGSAKTATGTFSVKTYLSSFGYVVTNAADPPKNNTNPAVMLSNLTSPTASTPGTEQFGINLVANTSPATVGANPVQVPSSVFSFGTVASGYGTTNQYKYVKGDTIASSATSTGTTAYTVTYLFNISNATPSGQYTFRHDMVATSTY